MSKGSERLVVVSSVALIGLGMIGIFSLFQDEQPNASFESRQLEREDRGDEKMERTTQNPQDRERQDTDEPPLLLKSIGVNLGAHDAVTGMAGDFRFTKEKIEFDRLFMGYGFLVPANSAGPAKRNPQPTYVLPLGTPVRSLVDGVVAAMPTLWSGDISVQVTEDGQLQQWIYEMEHVIRPTVQVGDRVRAGQIIGEVSDFDKGVPAGFGVTEIGILKGGNPPSHVCPYAYLDESIKQETFKKLRAFYEAWETYRGNPALYDESKETFLGCLTLDPIEG